MFPSAEVNEEKHLKIVQPMNLKQAALEAYFHDEQPPAKSARIQTNNIKNDIKSNKHKQNNSMFDEEI